MGHRLFFHLVVVCFCVFSLLNVHVAADSEIKCSESEKNDNGECPAVIQGEKVNVGVDVDGNLGLNFLQIPNGIYTVRELALKGFRWLIGLDSISVSKSEVDPDAGKTLAEESSDNFNANTASESFTVQFINNSPYRASLYWRQPESEELVRVVDVMPPGQSSSLNTYDTHKFIWTREGTRDQLGEPVIASPDVREYELPEDAKPTVTSCSDRYPTRCTDYAAHGECDKNPGWMIINCPVSCNRCELLEKKKRCDSTFLNVSAEHVWKTGDLDALFEGMISDDKYNIEVLSRPPEGPWILQFEDFLSENEADTLRDFGYKLGFQRSTDTGVENERGESTKIFSTSRTSTNAWCTGECEGHPTARGITERIVDVTKVPEENYEQFQLLKYDVGQFYRGHHDMSPKSDGNAGGVRILTFFLYLSDVEEGGETAFPRLGLKVKPKKGRAILWPSVTNENPDAQDMRTFHEALPVEKGRKYAANHWIHSHNFRVANLWGCTGAFD
mmetsp:Transcript_5321/g.6946  ORF Transcript_5321/g.6946 Transcript_5321/m.6946 type:complete len:501 (+) Transcript_5321:69-1571(+)